MKKMKFKYKIQQYQTDAVNSVIKVFEGQPKYDFTKYIMDVGKNNPFYKSIGSSGIDDANIAYKNHDLEVNDIRLLDNIKRVQSENNILRSTSLSNKIGKVELDVEMETGTGKTYVYIKTMFELNKIYGWSKFIVVVPSIAIREGVAKTFKDTEDHFMEFYGKKARYFVYNSSNLNMLDQFSNQSGINVMIINSQAFATSLKEGRKEARKIYEERDEFGSRKPIDVISANNPIIILDEPQKLNGKATQESLKRFKPLFSINYSATHKEQHNKVFVLDALDAFNKKLVKKIQVKGLEIQNLSGTNSYIYFDSIILSPTKPPVAKLEIEVNQKNGTVRKTLNFEEGDNLFYRSNEMSQYKSGYVISEINGLNHTITFTNGTRLNEREVIGDISELDIRRIQIRETIKSHLDKEQEMYKRGIKTLSLFFIDEVSKYREYVDGSELKGIYAKIFEEEYKNEVKLRQNLLDLEYLKYLNSIPVEKTHNGYFSVDKNKHFIDSEVKSKNEYSDDVSAYDLILKDKERLLSFDENTRFIFSHSALSEGWDNPNIFQICTLKHSDSNVRKRQEVGRGLRICVDKFGNRMDEDYLGIEVHDLNKLTVIASESYKNFVKDLQSDIASTLGDRPTKANVEYFTGKYILVDNKKHIITASEANDIDFYLISNGYIDKNREVTDTYRESLANSTLAELPDSISNLSDGINNLIQAIYDEKALNKLIEEYPKSKIENNNLNKNFDKIEFQNLWNRINHKYVYTVSFDSEELIKNSIDSINNKLFVSQLTYVVSTGEQRDELTKEKTDKGEMFGSIKTSRSYVDSVSTTIKYDLVGQIAQNTKLTRKTIVKILKGITFVKFEMFKANPEEFITKVSKLITEQKSTMIVEHISYDKTTETYDSSIFTNTKNSAPIEKAFKSKKAIQDYVFLDGLAENSVEKKFAGELDGADEVAVYAKLPKGKKGFYIPTPLGEYSPDWAIAFKEGTVKHIYFIAETKGSMSSLDLRGVENIKIECARKLFNSISTNDVKYHEVTSYSDLMNVIKSM